MRNMTIILAFMLSAGLSVAIASGEYDNVYVEVEAGYEVEDPPGAGVIEDATVYLSSGWEQSAVLYTNSLGLAYYCFQVPWYLKQGCCWWESYVPEPDAPTGYSFEYNFPDDGLIKTKPEGADRYHVHVFWLVED